jgi:hypothetical protein
MANNSYMRNGTGYYRYASIDDFLNQAAPRDFALTYGYDGEKILLQKLLLTSLAFMSRMNGTFLLISN